MSNCFVSQCPIDELHAAFFADRKDVSISPDTYSILMTKDEIDLIVRYVAEQINSHYVPIATHDKPVILIGLLTGCFKFASELTQFLRFPYQLKFINVGSYGKSTVQGDVQFVPTEIEQFRSGEFKDYPKLIIDELLDSGRTMKTMAPLIGANTAVAFVKGPGRYVDFLGIDQVPPSAWVVGYGLDDAGMYRGWGHLFAKRITAELRDEFRTNLFVQLEKLAPHASPDIYQTPVISSKAGDL
eukprot:gnl/Dysnectes_brevis/1209_a1351_2264.p1 GENE.gnl/Dysnectes_brevis/1209_a1351_2264~~gnl/Dysnectes_brevis/1209_a1351_2264.p1  ORF type:complete len:242 (+),score=53.11 gnl/Dysnectes_brevis/1209_a1351_2264:887-1612(+)